MRQDLDRALTTGDGRIDLPRQLESERLGAPPHLLQRPAAQVRIVDVAFFDLPIGELELWLDQHDALGARPQPERQSAEHVAGGDEADVDGEEVERPFGLVERQLSPVDPLERGHARVGGERRMQLTVPHVDRQDAGGAVGEQRLGESTGRSAHIDGARAAQRPSEPEMRDRRFKFSARAADRHARGLYPVPTIASGAGPFEGRDQKSRRSGTEGRD